MSLSKTRAVLFDLDDTLFDHRQSAARALRRVHLAESCFSAVTFEEFERLHADMLEEIHPDVVAGRIGMDEARRERFRRLYVHFGAAADDERCAGTASRYRLEYVAARKPVAGAAALLETVRRHAAIGVVSNNILQEQTEKLEHCGLAPHVDALIVSEVAGVSKPDPAIFEMALQALEAQASEAVMVGDSWSADVVGARAAGIRAVWFNPLRLPSPEPDAGVAEIYCLEPAEDVLEVILSSSGRGRARRP